MPPSYYRYVIYSSLMSKDQQKLTEVIIRSVADGDVRGWGGGLSERGLRRLENSKLVCVVVQISLKYLSI